ncbi:MAG TPA: TetR/AcrR family transcriptional regulator [candidate division WOR-3 bacterium]|uniref:TetR/AcrR family transcriptional regulator n=1 Tax=candidate division WOR-3 bacterium TaxID=2052148 RepID=A0A9C9ENM0_UNCW3|nr:TetR/AcrR family transcriptional regulator [candidate division WOR-3 bacterium]
MKKRETTVRHKIIKCALRIFSKKGYFRTTVEDIARAAHIAKGTVYLYFNDKESIYIAAINEHLNNATALFNRIAVQPGSATEKMNRISESFVNYLEKMKVSHPMFTFENIHLSSKVLKKLKQIITPRLTEMTKSLSRIIKQGIEQGEFREVDPDVAAFYFLVTMRTVFLGNLIIPEADFGSEVVLQLFFEGLKQRR